MLAQIYLNTVFATSTIDAGLIYPLSRFDSAHIFSHSRAS